MDVLYIVIPAYNEAQNLPDVIRQWYPIVSSHNAEGKSKLIVLNDGSRDETRDVLEELKKDRPLLEAVDKENEGHGPTLIRGYKQALAEHADFIFQTDSDGQTNPNEFESFWEKRHDYDAVFGNRTERGDGKQRAFVEKTLCHILHHYFRISVPDANAPFRLMSAEYLAKYLPRLRSDYNLPNVMLTVFGVYYHDWVTFIPISFAPRTQGKNSINMKKIFRIGRNALKDFRDFKHAM